MHITFTMQVVTECLTGIWPLKINIILQLTLYNSHKYMWYILLSQHYYSDDESKLPIANEKSTLKHITRSHSRYVMWNTLLVVYCVFINEAFVSNERIVFGTWMFHWEQLVPFPHSFVCSCKVTFRWKLIASGDWSGMNSGEAVLIFPTFLPKGKGKLNKYK